MGRDDRTGALLHTFRNVHDPDRAAQVVRDIAHTTGQPPEQVAIALAKAMLNPTGLLHLLGRHGIDPPEVLADGVLEDVQDQILTHIEDQYGGAADAT